MELKLRYSSSSVTDFYPITPKRVTTTVSLRQGSLEKGFRCVSSGDRKSDFQSLLAMILGKFIKLLSFSFSIYEKAIVIKPVLKGCEKIKLRKSLSYSICHIVSTQCIIVIITVIIVNIIPILFSLLTFQVQNHKFTPSESCWCCILGSLMSSVIYEKLSWFVHSCSFLYFSLVRTDKSAGFFIPWNTSVSWWELESCVN